MGINVEDEIKMGSTDFKIEIILEYSVDPMCSPRCSSAEDEGRRVGVRVTGRESDLTGHCWL